MKMPRVQSCCCGVCPLEKGCLWSAYLSIVFLLLGFVNNLFTNEYDADKTVGGVILFIGADLLFIFVAVRRRFAPGVFAYFVFSVVEVGLYTVSAVFLTPKVITDARDVAEAAVMFFSILILVGLHAYSTVIVYSYYMELREVNNASNGAAQSKA